MIERILLIFWGAWLLFVLIAAFRVISFNIARRSQDRKWANFTRNQRPAAVIVAVKGFDPGRRLDFLTRFSHRNTTTTG